MKSHNCIFFLLMMVLCGCHGDYNELGGEYIYTNGEIGKQIHGGGSGYFPYESLIPNRVLYYNYDDSHIVAYQVPEKEWIEFKKDYVSKEVADSLQNLFVKMVNIYYCYWIVSKQDGVIYGPLSKTNFIKTCDSLKCRLFLDQ